MTKSKSTPQPKAPGNPFVAHPDLGPVNTIEHCRNIIEFVRQANTDDGIQEVEFGRFLVLGLVSDALAHAATQIGKPREVSHG